MRSTALLPCLCSVALAIPVFSQSLTFTNLSYDRGAAYFSTPTVALSDVSGDGRLDLICANFFDSTLSVLTNTGTGRFTLKSTLPVGANPALVVSADVNGDSKADLVSGNATTLTVLTNNGAGDFAFKSTTILTNQNPISLTTADVNADGRIDLVTANIPVFPESDYTVMVFTNNGAGVFSQSVSLRLLPFSMVPPAATTADVNADGRPDLVCLDNLGAGGFLLIYTNNGSGVFTSNAFFRVGASVSAFAADDVNGDGRVDLLVPDAGNNLLTVWTNNGAGVFATNNSCAIGTGESAGDVKVADLNGDGKPDLLVTRDGTCPASDPPCDNGSVIILTNNGTGTFALAAAITAGVWTVQVVPGEVNNDGKMDFVCVNHGYTGYANNTVVEYFNTSTLARPSLRFLRSGTGMVLQWPAYAGNYVLETNAALGTANWGAYGGVIYNNGMNKSITNTPSLPKAYYRLKR